MKCPECGGNVTEETGEHPYIGTELPDVVLTGVKIRKCKECGKVSVGIPQLARLHRALVESIAGSHHRLRPGEICFLRKYLGWSGQNFARHFGVTVETVSRWENGKQPMGGTAERLLRLLAMTADQAEGYPLPDEFADRPRVRKLRAALRGKSWVIAA